MRFDLQAYQRKLKTTAFFLLNKHNSENIPFTPKSGWTPTAGQTTETIQQIIQRDWTYFNHKLEIDKIQSNLTRAEIKALRLLAQNKRIKQSSNQQIKGMLLKFWTDVSTCGKVIDNYLILIIIDH